jgi:hypothetical protein
MKNKSKEIFNLIHLKISHLDSIDINHKNKTQFQISIITIMNPEKIAMSKINY